MFNYLDFDDVFGFDTAYSYQQDSVHAIEANRRELEGLFIDKVLKILGIKRRKSLLLLLLPLSYMAYANVQ